MKNQIRTFILCSFLFISNSQANTSIESHHPMLKRLLGKWETKSTEATGLEQILCETDSKSQNEKLTCFDPSHRQGFVFTLDAKTLKMSLVAGRAEMPFILKSQKTDSLLFSFVETAETRKERAKAKKNELQAFQSTHTSAAERAQFQSSIPDAQPDMSLSMTKADHLIWKPNELSGASIEYARKK